MELTIGEEQVPPGEEGVIEELVALQLAIMKKTDATRRGQHGKAHGYCDATFRVHDNVPSKYRAGVFTEPGTYEARVRWSNGGSADDMAPDIHGMAIKVLGVKGARALDGGPEEQDFILIDSEVFFASDVKTLLAFMKARAASAARPEIMKEFAQHHPSTVALLTAALKTVPSPLAVRYWSTVPYRLGDQAVKYTAMPAPENGPGDMAPASADYLRHAMVARLAPGHAVVAFELCVIPQTDAVAMPIEDPTVQWESEPVPVATITVAPQTFDTPDRIRQGETASFDPWHALAVHRPLGGINRARKAVYVASAALRHGSPAMA
jgi:hypothetical protein